MILHKRNTFRQNIKSGCSQIIGLSSSLQATREVLNS